MEAHYVDEERAGNRCCRVWVPERDEVRVIGESVNDGEDDALAMDFRQPLDEVHGNICPYGHT